MTIIDITPCMFASESNRIRLDGGLCDSGIRAGEGRFDGTGAESMSDAKLCWRLVNSSSSDKNTTDQASISNTCKQH